MNKLFIIFIIFFVAINGCKKKSELENLIPEKLSDFKLDQINHKPENILVNLIPNISLPKSSSIKALFSFEQNSAELFLYSYEDTLSAITAFHYIMRGVRTDTINYQHILPRFNENLFFIMALKGDKANYIFTKSRYVYWLKCEKSSGENIIEELIKYSR